VPPKVFFLETKPEKLHFFVQNVTGLDQKRPTSVGSNEYFGNLNCSSPLNEQFEWPNCPFIPMLEGRFEPNRFNQTVRLNPRYCTSNAMARHIFSTYYDGVSLRIKIIFQIFRKSCP
jgi:hypothetical protein